MTVCINGVASKSYDDDMRLQPMLGNFEKR